MSKYPLGHCLANIVHPNSIYADANIDDAAKWMQRVVNDQPFRDTIVDQAQRHTTQYSIETIGKLVSNQLNYIAEKIKINKL